MGVEVRGQPFDEGEMKGVGRRFGSTPTGWGRATDGGAQSGGSVLWNLFIFLPLFPLHRLFENYVDVLNHFKHKFTISMLQCLFIFDCTIESCSPLMIFVFTW
jgi:hypothetical protein